MLEHAKKTLNHYMSQNYAQRGWKWENDNKAEIDSIFEDIEAEIKNEVKRQINELMTEKFQEIGEDMHTIISDMKKIAYQLKQYRDANNIGKDKTGLVIDKPFYKKNLDGDLDG